MKNYILRPNISLYPGIRVDKDTVLEYRNDKVEQRVENLVFHSIVKVSGDTYDSVCETTVRLQDGDILIFEDEGRGYIKPVEAFVEIQEAIEDLENIKELGGE